ncbi:MAG TPA: DUF3325 domain-containing protein [Rhodocyclaceae bacterium]|nr:DUF3325 domain-containing protein [Rhodocyclaceae bacterium]
MLLAAGLAGYGAWACLALALPRHWVAANGERGAFAPAPKRALRASGGALLGLAYALCWYRDGAAFGSVLWLLLMTAVAFAVAFTLAWRPCWFRPLTVAARR